MRKSYMRKSFNGLSEIARNTINIEPSSGAALIYTMVEQARRHDHDPFAHFAWVFEKLMPLDKRKEPPPEAELETPLPSAWLSEQR